MAETLDGIIHRADRGSVVLQSRLLMYSSQPYRSLAVPIGKEQKSFITELSSLFSIRYIKGKEL